MGWVSFYILSKISVWLVCYPHGFHGCKSHGIVLYMYVLRESLGMRHF